MTGTGTAADPYLVATAADLAAVGSAPSAHYRQAADLDLAGDWAPIAGPAGEPFSGVYDGAGHVVRGLRVRAPGGFRAGLFAHVQGGEVRDLGVEGADCHVGRYGGALAGQVSGGGAVRRCYATGAVRGDRQEVGGLVGELTAGVVEDSWTDVLVVQTSDSTASSVYYGGLVGDPALPGGVVRRCYALGRARSDAHPADARIGAVCGDDYDATGGPSFWDADRAPGLSDPRAQARTTAQLRSGTPFPEWADASAWTFEPGSYPRLSWMAAPYAPAGGRGRRRRRRVQGAWSTVTRRVLVGGTWVDTGAPLGEALSVALTATPSTVAAGQLSTLSAVVTGGAGDRTVRFYETTSGSDVQVGPAQSGPGSEFTQAVSVASGAPTYVAEAADAGGRTARSAPVSVSAVPEFVDAVAPARTAPAVTSSVAHVSAGQPDPVPANALAGLAHPQIDIASGLFRGTGAGTTAETAATAVDGDVVGFSKNGSLLARIGDDDRALALGIRTITAGGEYRVVVVNNIWDHGVKGLVPGSFERTLVNLDDADLQAAVPGYDPLSTGTTLFRLRVRGFSVAVALSLDDGATWTTVWEDPVKGALLYREGRFGWHSHTESGYGHRRLGAALHDTEPMRADPLNGAYDAVDLGLRSVNARGTVEAADLSRVVLDRAAPFRVGDDVAVAVGGEPGFQARGFTGGVGGYYPGPAATVATRADLPATIAGVKGSGYKLTDNFYAFYVADEDTVTGTYTDGGVVSYRAPKNAHYDGRPNPLAHRAAVTAVESDGSGNTVLVLDAPCHNPTAGAWVHVLNDGSFAAASVLDREDTFAAAPTVSVPEGDFFFWESQTWRGLADGAVRGAGKHRTRFRNAEGGRHTEFQISGSPRVEVRDVAFHGTWRRDGGFAHWPLDGANALRLSLSDDAVVEDVLFHHCPDALDVSFSARLRARYVRCDSTGNAHYVQWQVQVSDSPDVVVEDAAVVSDWLVAGFEPFKCDRAVFRRFSAVNAVGSMNGSDGSAFEDVHVWVDADSEMPENGGVGYNPALQSNANAAPGGADNAFRRVVVAQGGLPRGHLAGHERELELVQVLAAGPASEIERLVVEDLVAWAPPALRTVMDGAANVVSRGDASSDNLYLRCRNYTSQDPGRFPRGSFSFEDAAATATVRDCVGGTVYTPGAGAGAQSVVNHRTLDDWRAQEGPWGPPTADFVARPVAGGGYDLFVYDPETGAEVAFADGHAGTTASAGRRLVRHEWEYLSASGAVVGTDRGRYAVLPPQLGAASVRLRVWDEDEVEASVTRAPADAAAPFVTVGSYAAMTALDPAALPDGARVRVLGSANGGRMDGVFVVDGASGAPTDGARVFALDADTEAGTASVPGTSFNIGHRTTKKLLPDDLVWGSVGLWADDAQTLRVTSKYLSGAQFNSDQRALLDHATGTFGGGGQNGATSGVFAKWNGGARRATYAVDYRRATSPRRLVREAPEGVWNVGWFEGASSDDDAVNNAPYVNWANAHAHGYWKATGKTGTVGFDGFYAVGGCREVWDGVRYEGVSRAHEVYWPARYRPGLEYEVTCTPTTRGGAYVLPEYVLSWMLADAATPTAAEAAYEREHRIFDGLNAKRTGVQINPGAARVEFRHYEDDGRWETQTYAGNDARYDGGLDEIWNELQNANEGVGISQYTSTHYDYAGTSQVVLVDCHVHGHSNNNLHSNTQSDWSESSDVLYGEQVKNHAWYGVSGSPKRCWGYGFSWTSHTMVYNIRLDDWGYTFDLFGRGYAAHPYEGSMGTYFSNVISWRGENSGGGADTPFRAGARIENAVVDLRGAGSVSPQAQTLSAFAGSGAYAEVVNPTVYTGSGAQSTVLMAAGSNAGSPFDRGQADFQLTGGTVYDNHTTAGDGVRLATGTFYGDSFIDGLTVVNAGGGPACSLEPLALNQTDLDSRYGNAFGAEPVHNLQLRGVVHGRALAGALFETTTSGSDDPKPYNVWADGTTFGGAAPPAASSGTLRTFVGEAASAPVVRAAPAPVTGYAGSAAPATLRTWDVLAHPDPAAATWSLTSTLSAGVVTLDPAAGTVTVDFSGAPAAGESGSFDLTLTAGAASRTVTVPVTVKPAPADARGYADVVAATRVVADGYAGPLVRAYKAADGSGAVAGTDYLDVGADGAGRVDQAALLGFAAGGDLYAALFKQDGSGGLVLGPRTDGPVEVKLGRIVAAGAVETNGLGEAGLYFGYAARAAAELARPAASFEASFYLELERRGAGTTDETVLAFGRSTIDRLVVRADGTLSWTRNDKKQNVALGASVTGDAAGVLVVRTGGPTTRFAIRQNGATARTTLSRDRVSQSTVVDVGNSVTSDLPTKADSFQGVVTAAISFDVALSEADVDGLFATAPFAGL